MQRETDISSLFDRSGNLTLRTLERYLKDELNPDELEIVEQHFEKSPFDREAMEGFRSYRDKNFSGDIRGLNQRIEEAIILEARRLRPAIKKQVYWYAAAGILLIATISLLLFIINKEPVLKNQLTINQSEHIQADSATNIQIAQQQSVTQNEIAVRPPDIIPLSVVNDDKISEAKNTIIQDDVIIEADAEPDLLEEKVPSTEQDQIIETYDMHMGQAVEEEDQETQIFMVVEQMPEFPGGEEKLYKFLSDSIGYPELAKQNHIQGKVYVAFVVEKDGSVTDARIIRGIGGGCDEEALRVIKLMPKWIPGKQRGIPIRVQYTLPVKFTLQ